MKIKKSLVYILSAVMSANLLAGNLITSVSNAGYDEIETETASTQLPLADDEKCEHAYDPMSEWEEQQAEKEYRENADIIENKVLFSVTDRRAEESTALYLDETSEICRNNNLKNVSMIYETADETCSEKDGYAAFEVFYEASTSDNVWSVVDALNETEGVVSAEPDFIWKNTAEGTYTEVSEEEYSAESYFENLNVRDVWNNLNPDRMAGKGTVVAVIDTGVDYNHKDLAANIWTNTAEIPNNGIDDDRNGYIDDIHGMDFVENDGDPMDDHGHGTHVAGIIAMAANGTGGVGLAYNSKIMCVKAGQSDGTFASSDIAKAIKYAADNGADVINMSFGGIGRSSLVEAALRDAFATTVLVASAGNDGLPTNDAQLIGYARTEDIYPAGYNYVTGVMATYDYNQLASFSNWDFINGANCEYEIAAPGVNIYSTLPNNRYAKWSGTSMAAPVVAAAAAIIRAEHPEKSKYNSRYIMGLLISATESRVPYLGSLGDYHLYSWINIADSLNKQPKPKVHLKDAYILDTENISDANNNDGIAQPGEIIDLGLSVWNRWGAAKEVTVKADAVSDGGVPNPYIEFINDTVTIGEVGSFAEVNNGWIYEDGMFTAVSNPIRFRIKEGAPNDVHIQINFTITAKNDMDESDTEVYEQYPNPSYTIIVQNGCTLSGVIREDMTLTADKYWIIENNVLIPEGVTLTVEPGTQIQFWSADPQNPYGDNADVFIQVEGRFIAEGTEENPIQMFPDKNYEDKSVIIFGKEPRSEGMVDTNYENEYTSFRYVSIINPGITEILLNRSFEITNADHCHFVCNYQNFPSLINALIFKNITNSDFKDFNYEFGTKGYILSEKSDTCQFDTCTSCMGAFYTNLGSLFRNIRNKTTKNNVYLNSRAIHKYLNEMMYGKFYIDKKETFENNAILNQYTDLFYNFVYADKGHETYDISGNYWGTTNPLLVKKQCFDADFNISYNNLIQEPYLTLGDDMSSIYPFMTEAYITDKDGNRLDSAGGGQAVELHVKFNRDMAQDVQPLVTYGGSAPFTDYYVNGNWTAPREWVGELNIDPFIDMGRMYIRTKGAAAEDKWLVTGEDAARFFFEITKNSAQSMSLQGTGQSGQNELSWIQDDYDTLAGYNVYRSLSYDKNEELSQQFFQKVNTSVISADEASFIDRNVEQGVDYYYYFTVVDTAFNESKASNVVKCTPIDEIAPVINHVPVINAVNGEAVVISAEVTDNVKVESVKLNYCIGNGEWQSSAMKNVNGNVYRGQISAYEVGNEPIKYYITASDGTNISSSAASDNPYIISINDGHNYGEGKIVIEPGCTESGKAEYICIDCGKVKSEEIQPKGHIFSDKWIVDTEASCIEKGEKSHHCLYCSERSNVTEIPVTEHLWNGGRVTLNPTCTSDGEKKFVCVYCGETRTEKIMTSGHSYTETMYEADCQNQGYTEHECMNCGLIYKSNFIKKTAHIYTETILNNAGCTNSGTAKRVCDVCGDYKLIEIPPIQHDFVSDIVEPTCTEQGFTEHECLNCGFIYKNNFTKKTEHTYTENILNEAGCTYSGITKRICAVCGNYEFVEIPPTHHKFVSEIIDPTYTRQGYTVNTCIKCGYEYIDSYTQTITSTEAATTAIVTTTTVKPSAVTNLRVLDNDLTIIRFGWDKNSRAEGYVVEQYSNGAWVRVYKGKALEYKAEELTANCRYEFRVKAYATVNSTVVSSDWEVISAQTTAEEKVAAVTNLRVLGTVSTAIRFGWDKNIKAEGYVVEQYVNGAWNRVYKGTALEYKATGLKPDSQYEFRVKSYATISGTIVSSSWKVLSAQTNAQETVEAVTNLSILGTHTSAIRFGWDKNSKAEGYVVEQYVNGAWSRIYKGNALEYKVTGLKPDSRYEFRVKAYATISGKVVSSEWTILSAKTNR